MGWTPQKQHKKFLEDSKTSVAVAGGVEAPVSSVGSVQTKVVQQMSLGRAG